MRRRFASSLLAILLLTTASSAVAADNTRTAGTPTKGVVLSGKVSPNGKVFIADDDTVWKVMNAELLKGLANAYVVLKCQMTPSTTSIRVLSVVTPDTGQKSRVSDAAFRR